VSHTIEMENVLARSLKGKKKIYVIFVVLII